MCAVVDECRHRQRKVMELSLSDEKEPFPITALDARGPCMVDATKLESSEESESVSIIMAEDVEEDEVFELAVAPTDLEEPFYDARMFLTLFAYSYVKGR